MATLCRRLLSGFHHRPCLTTRVNCGTRATSTAPAVREVLRKELDSIRAAGTWKSERVITSPQAASITVQGRSGTLLNFCANNYLGLSVSCSGPRD